MTISALSIPELKSIYSPMNLYVINDGNRTQGRKYSSKGGGGGVQGVK